MLGKHSTTKPYLKPFLSYFRIWQIKPFLSPHFKTCQRALESQSPFPNIPHSVLILFHPEMAGLLQGDSLAITSIVIITGPQLSNLLPLSVRSSCVMV